MKEPQTTEQDSKAEGEEVFSLEKFKLWGLGILLTLISGIIAILATSLESESVENQHNQSSELSTVQLFSNQVLSSPNPLALNPSEQSNSGQQIQPLNAQSGVLINRSKLIQNNNLFSSYSDSKLAESHGELKAKNVQKNELSGDNFLRQAVVYLSLLTAEKNFLITQQNSVIPKDNNFLVSLQLPQNFSDTTLFKPQQSVAQTAPSLPILPSTSEISELDGVELTLRDVIILALENNRTIKNQYLERIVQREELAVAEDKFNPDFTPELAIEWVNLNQGTRTDTTQGLDLSARMVVKIPTGGEINLGWLGRGQQEALDGFADRDGLRQNLELSFRQPLLRGAGQKVNRASIEVARLNENINLLRLKTILIDQITETTFAYRQLLQAQRRVLIAQQSLAIAQQQVQNTQILIEAGRLARAELITVQTRVADQEVAVLEAFNNFKQQQLNLLQLLDIDEEVDIIVSDTLEIMPPNFDEQIIQQLALENRPRYLVAKLDLERAKTELIVAENNRRWNIDLTAQLFHEPTSNITTNRTDSRAGISFSKTLGDRNIELEFQRRRVDVLQAENNLTEEFQNININLEQRLQDIQDNFKKVELARRVVELTEQQLRNEEEKVKLGVPGASVVNLVDFQSQLTNARNNELNAIIDYQNALTNLAQTLGTTLEAWDVTIEPKPPQPNE